MKKYKHKKSQQLVEFLLVAPFLIIILGVLTEYAYALNINMTLTQGLKTVTSSIYSEIKPEMSGSDIEKNVLSELTDYMKNNNAPVKSENKLQVGYVLEGQTAIFMAHYTYIPAFTLPNVYFRIMPDQFDFLTTSSVPSAFVNPNNYDSSLNSQKLDGIWSASNFSSVNTYNGSQHGIMKENDSNNGRSKILFLIPVLNTSNLYSLVHWNGKVDDCKLNATTGKIFGTECGSYSGQGFISYLTAPENNYYNVIFIHDADLQNVDIDTSTLSDYWAYATGGSYIEVNDSTDISSKNVDGVLKRSLALVDLTSNLSLGNYDNADVYSYNADVAATGSTSTSTVATGGNTTGNITGNTTNYAGFTYTMTPFGSIIFMHTSQDTDTISAIINGSSPTEYSYNFNK